MKDKLKAIWRLLFAKEWVYITNNGKGYRWYFGVPTSIPEHVESPFEGLMLIKQRSLKLAEVMKVIASDIEGNE